MRRPAEWAGGGARRPARSVLVGSIADMAGSRVPRQLFLQGVAAVFMFAFASLYTQIPGLYGPEGILPARKTLRPQGKGRWQQLWETPTLLWEAPRLGLDTAQGLELLTLLGTVLALGTLLLNSLRHSLIYFLLWAAYLSAYQALLQVLIIVTGNYNFFNLLTLVLTTSLLDDDHLSAEPGLNHHKKITTSWPKALLTILSLLLKLATCGLLAYGTVYYFDLEVDWQQYTIRSRTTFTFHQFSQWLKTVTLPTVWLGVASLAWELLKALWRWTQLRGWLRKFYAAIQLSISGTAVVTLFLISLVPYSYVEPGTHGRLWTPAHRLFGAVEHLQLANSYGLFRRMTGVGGRPEVVLEGSYDGHHWTEIEFMYKPGNVSRPPPVLVPHQPRLDWQMWFAALGPHTHSPWFTKLVLCLLQGKEPVIHLIQNNVTMYPFHKQPPTYIRAQRYKYWFSPPGKQGQWWRRQWVEEFFPPVSLGDPTLEMLLRQFGLQDKSPPRARSPNNSLSQALNWIRMQLSPLEPPTLLWGLLGAVAAVRVMQAMLAPWSLQSSPLARREKHKPAPKKDSGAASDQAAPGPNSSTSSSRITRRKK